MVGLLIVRRMYTYKSVYEGEICRFSKVGFVDVAVSSIHSVETDAYFHFLKFYIEGITIFVSFGSSDLILANLLMDNFQCMLSPSVSPVKMADVDPLFAWL
jgi:hypothetical protein